MPPLPSAQQSHFAISNGNHRAAAVIAAMQQGTIEADTVVGYTWNRQTREKQPLTAGKLTELYTSDSLSSNNLSKGEAWLNFTKVKEVLEKLDPKKLLADGHGIIALVLPPDQVEAARIFSNVKEMRGHTSFGTYLKQLVQETGTNLGKVASEVSSVAKKGLKSVAPAADAIVEGAAYKINQHEGSTRIHKILAEAGVKNIGTNAADEYAEIFSGAKLEQGASNGFHDAIGFSKFISWGVKYDIPLEAMQKLNPTQRSNDEVKRVLEMRADRLAMLDVSGDPQRADVPDIRPGRSRGNGLA